MSGAILPWSKIPEGWFLYGLGECVTPIHYRHDTHDNTGEGFWCELQHREGGKMTRATGASPEDALEICVDKVCRQWPDHVP